MNSELERDLPINDELFHLYAEYQLCKVKKNKPSLWNADDNEKNALIDILAQCQKVNGDLLRSVMEDIFENSVAKFPDNNSARVFQQTSHMNSKSNRTPQVIVNPIQDDDDDDDDDDDTNDPEPETSSREVATSSSYITKHHYIDRMNIDIDQAAVSRRNILPSSTPRRRHSETPIRIGHSEIPIKRDHSKAIIRQEIKKEKQKQKQKEKAKTKAKDEEDHTVQGLLTMTNVEMIPKLASEVATTTTTLQNRIYTIKDSLIVNLSSTIQGTFSVLNYQNCPGTTDKIMHRCQENWIGYQFGKLVERLHQEYSEQEAHDRAKLYYKELQRELRRQQRTYYTNPWSMFIYYSKRMVQYVNEFGIYSIFIPEILAPYRFKRLPYEDIRAILRHVDASCHVFKNIVQLDRQGNVIAPPREQLSENRMMNKAASSGSILPY